MLNRLHSVIYCNPNYLTSFPVLSIRFEEENYIVNETAGTVTVCVERVGRAANPIMVTINAAESFPSDASGT